MGVDLGIDKIITYEIKDSVLTEVNCLSVNPEWSETYYFSSEWKVCVCDDGAEFRSYCVNI